MCQCLAHNLLVLTVSGPQVDYCTKLKQAQSDAEREEIENAMREDVVGGGPAILAALYQTQTSAQWAQARSGQFRSRVRQEARRLGKTSQLEEKVGARYGLTLRFLLLTSFGLCRMAPKISRLKCLGSQDLWRKKRKTVVPLALIAP